jgi:tetratricopeptide (TPR) repeat protein
MAALALSGCASTVSAPAPTQRVSADEWRYILPPLTGYALTVPLGTERELTAAATGLADSTAWPVVRDQSEALLEIDPGLHPATLLLAQVSYLERDYTDVLSRLRPVVEELPDYDAAQLVLGRAAEQLGDLPTAYAAYRASSTRLNLAAARASQLRERSVEIVYNRLADALARGRVLDATRDLALLAEWAPNEPTTLRAARGVAVATGDLERELQVVSALSALDPADRSLEERQAELELEVGEPSTGLRILQDLTTRYPDDLELAEKLAEAKFIWRLVMLPKEVKQLVQLNELGRGDFAAVLYWLFPQVRYGQATAGLIVNDIFEHPAREQIVKVVNLELMPVDRAMHQFEPDRTITRVEALASFLALLSRADPAPACLGAYQPDIGASVDGICEAAARCEVIADAGDCLPGGPLSGAAAAQMSRKALEQLGVE